MFLPFIEQTWISDSVQNSNVRAICCKWSSWTPCSKNCGNGTQTRHREQDYQPQNDGQNRCTQYPLEETRSCKENECPGFTL